MELQHIKGEEWQRSLSMKLGSKDICKNFNVLIVRIYTKMPREATNDNQNRWIYIHAAFCRFNETIPILKLHSINIRRRWLIVQSKWSYRCLLLDLRDASTLRKDFNILTSRQRHSVGTHQSLRPGPQTDSQTTLSTFGGCLLETQAEIRPRCTRQTGGRIWIWRI